MSEIKQKLILLNQRGLLPERGEEMEAFFQRAEHFPPLYKTSEEGMQVHDALRLCKELFDMQPDWVAIYERQKGLSLWQGAALWIQQEDQLLIPFVQISPRLKWVKKWYPLQEILAHELLHAMRLPLSSSHFEEIAAYQTSKSSFRRYFGPVIRSSAEVYIFLGALIPMWMQLIWPLFFYCTFIAPALCIFASARLFFAQRTFRRCKKTLSCLLKEKSKALALLVRLSDEEVRFFARACPTEIERYVQQKEKEELRWQMLSIAYPLEEVHRLRLDAETI